MSTILTAHRALVTLWEGVEITDPVVSSIKRVYPFAPPARVALGDTPCIVLTYEQRGLGIGPGAHLHKNYTTHAHVFIGRAEADTDVKCEMAAAFNDALIQALVGGIRLHDGAITVTDLRGAPDTLAVLEWSGQGYVGLDLFLDFQIDEAVTYAA